MIRKIVAVMLAVFLLTATALAVSAQEILDLKRKGSLTFLLDDDGVPLDGGALHIIRVGEIVHVRGEYRYELIKELRPGPALDRLESPELAEELYGLVIEKNLTMDKSLIVKGKAEFSDLDLGLYLVVQPQLDAPEGYHALSPFLMTIPQVVDGYVYDVTAAPKLEPTPAPTVPPEITVPPTPPPTSPPTPPKPGLPQTGQLNWPVPLLFVTGLAFVTVGWYLRSGKKESYEK